MTRSALSIYTTRYADQLDPETKQILARLPDNVVQLVHAALDDDETPRPPMRGSREDVPGWWPRMRDRMRCNVPALNLFSDEEFDLALDVAIDTYPDDPDDLVD